MPLSVAKRTASAVVIGWSDDCLAIEDETPASVGLLFGCAIVEHFGSAQGDTFSLP